MHRYQYDLLKDEAIYIAGPECFYTHGFDMLGAMRKKAESLGFSVTLPNDNPLDMGNPVLQKRADSIFEDLKHDMNKTTVIISDLETFRGAEPDSGTIYEIGMAYAKGAKSYGYTRDKRSLGTKNQGAIIKDGIVYDEKGNKMPYAQLPFSPNIIGSTKVIEGPFEACINTLILDIEEEKKLGNTQEPYTPPTSQEITGRPRVFLSDFERYSENGKEILDRMKAICQEYGLDAVSSLDEAQGVHYVPENNIYAWATNVCRNNAQHVHNCDVIIANLNDFRGYETNNDVAFECGMGFQLGKRLYGFMDDARPMIEKIPHLGEEHEYRDHTGSNVENFNYPANLMFACSMKIFEGKFEEVIKKIAEDLKK